MSIQLLSVSHRYAPLKVREQFAFDQEQQLQLMMRIKEYPYIEETVILSTCNRTEIYIYSTGEMYAREAFEWVKTVALTETGTENVENMGDYIRLYQGERAVHHLFLVASGLDSMVIGEDQILGQVKRAHTYARENGMCKTYLNTFFRFAVTSAKKVKTDTQLSKTPVSTASLAVKVAEEEFHSLVNKKIMLIGATGKIGSVVLKNLQCVEGAQIYVTTRNHNSSIGMKHNLIYEAVPYEERYYRVEEMDVVISATTSPHYTLTYHHLLKYVKPQKHMVFIDLAVPMDIESKIGQLTNISYYNIDDFTKIAEENNEIKQQEAKMAGLILEDYEVQFHKWLIFQQALPELELTKDKLLKLAKEKGTEKMLNQLFYGIREISAPHELSVFLETINQFGKD